MAYTDKARSMRRCVGTNKDGSPCKNYAGWGDPEQKCYHHRSEPRPKVKARCRCAAYLWTHRPGSGLCRWPDPPKERWVDVSEQVKATRREELRLAYSMAFAIHQNLRDGDSIS